MALPPTIALTFDNLGAAAEIEQGCLPEGTYPDHPSLAALERILALLDELDLRGTFFVEATNTADHPDALRAIAEAGHELGFHAWRHERWGELEPDRERKIVERSFRAYADAGLEVRAFRPPGGGLTAGSVALLRAAGVRWCSPKGTRAGLDDGGMAHLPFRWGMVDATWLYEPFADLRRELGVSAAPLDAAAFEARMWEELEREDDPEVGTLILHPFLVADAASGNAHERILRRLAAQAADRTVRVVPGGVAAEELRGRQAAPVARIG